MTTFQKVKLGDVADMRYGTMPLKKKVGSGDYEIFSGYRYSDKYPEFNCKKGDVVIVARGVGGTGDIKIARCDCYLTNLSIKISLDHAKVNNRYFYYKYLLKTLRYLDTGSAQSQITINNLENLQVDLPDLQTQSHIASVLSAYDDLIENNEKRIKTLEEMAQLLYTEWFVKFKFPCHEKVKMVDNGTEYGMVPEGWEVKKLGQIFDSIHNSTHEGEHLNARQYVPIENIPKKSFAIKESSSWNKAQSSLILFEKRDILFGAMRPYFHKVSIALNPGVTRTTCLVLRPKKDYFCSYGFLTVFSNDFISFASSNTQGATIPYAVWKNSLENYTMLVPNDKVLIRFEKIIKIIIDQVGFLTEQINTLSKIRDLLIPQLVTGKRELKQL
jgi:type I restriction enzyme S subunit